MFVTWNSALERECAALAVGNCNMGTAVVSNVFARKYLKGITVFKGIDTISASPECSPLEEVAALLHQFPLQD